MSQALTTGGIPTRSLLPTRSVTQATSLSDIVTRRRFTHLSIAETVVTAGSITRATRPGRLVVVALSSGETVTKSLWVHKGVGEVLVTRDFGSRTKGSFRRVIQVTTGVTDTVLGFKPKVLDVDMVLAVNVRLLILASDAAIFA